jgi:L-rhamnose isomerase
MKDLIEIYNFAREFSPPSHFPAELYSKNRLCENQKNLIFQAMWNLKTASEKVDARDKVVEDIEMYQNLLGPL